MTRTCRIQSLLNAAVLIFQRQPALGQKVVRLLRLQVAYYDAREVPRGVGAHVVVPDAQLADVAQVELRGDAERVDGAALEGLELLQQARSALAV